MWKGCVWRACRNNDCAAYCMLTSVRSRNQDCTDTKPLIFRLTARGLVWMAPLFAGALGWAWLASVSLAVAQCTPTAIQKAQPDMPPKCACTIGPVSFQVPACDIKTEEFGEERWDYVVWA